MTFTSFNLSDAFTGDDLPPIAYPIPGMNAGTILALDFTNTQCVSASGLITEDTEIVDLSGVQSGCLLEGTLGGRITVSTTGLVFPSGGFFGNTCGIKVPMPDFDVTAPHLVSLWMAETTEPPDGSMKTFGISPAANRSANKNLSSIFFDNGPDAGVGMRGSFLPSGAELGVFTTTSIPGVALGTVFCYGFAWVPGYGSIESLNGTAVRSTTSTATELETVVDPTLYATVPAGGEIYALMIERLDLSGRSAAVAAAAEYAARAEQFM